MIRSKRALFILGALVFVIGLIVTFPARVAVGLMPPIGLAISGIEGTVWRGSASEASITGIYLRNIRWEARPLQLFTGRLSYDIEATPVSGFVETGLSIGLDKKLQLSNLTAAVPLDLFANVIGIEGLQGNTSLNFSRVELLDGIAVVADGEMQAANIIVPPISRDSLGAYKAEFRSQNNGIVAALEDTDGVLDLAGSLQIGTDRSYKFLAYAKLTNKTPDSIRRQLQTLPTLNERGQYELRDEGRF